MRWLIWRLRVALEMRDRYGGRFRDAWHDAGELHATFALGATPDEIVWGED